VGTFVTEEQRLEALRRYDILDTPEEVQFDIIVQLAAQFFRAPIALVSLVDAERQWFKAKIGLTATETSRASSFCTHAIENDEPLVVTNAVADERFKHHPAVLGDPHVRFYAGAPLQVQGGARIGTLCIVDTRERMELPPAAIMFLKSMARRTVEVIELRSAMRDHIAKWPPCRGASNSIEI
jgi:GAF domain-containing protein